jgi:hypothetical protein
LLKEDVPIRKGNTIAGCATVDDGKVEWAVKDGGCGKVSPLGEIYKILLSDVLRDVWGRFDKMIGVIDGKSPLQFVVFWPETLIWGVELSVVRVTDQEIDEHFAILKSIWIMIESMFEIDLDELPFDVF